MLRTTRLVKKLYGDIRPGELLRCSFGGENSLALLLQPTNGGLLFGIITSPAFERPMTWHVSQREGVCLSYGMDWLIEEIHGPETVCGARHLYRDAYLFLDGGLSMAFTTPKGQFGFAPTYFDLESSQVSSLSEDAAPIRSWRLWESIEHFGQSNTPLFEMVPV